MSEPAPKFPPENSPPLTALKELGWPDDALAREARLLASLPVQQERFRELLAAIAG